MQRASNGPIGAGTYMTTNNHLDCRRQHFVYYIFEPLQNPNVVISTWNFLEISGVQELTGTGNGLVSKL